jgi:hypothetical protein
MNSIFFFIILFMNFKVFDLHGKSVALSELLIVLSVFHLILILFFNKYNFKPNIIVAYYFLILVIPVFSALLSTDISEGVKSCIQLFVSSLFVFLIYTCARYKYRTTYITAFISANLILASVGIFQFIFISYFGFTNRLLVYPFLDQTVKVQTLLYNYGPSSWRSPSLYFEPSIFGLYGTYAFLLVEYSNFRQRRLIKGILFFGIISSLSTSAFFILTICTVLQYLKTISRRFFQIKRILLLLVWFLIIIFLIHPFSPISARVIRTFNKFDQLSAIGTSGYFRIIAPFQLAKYVATNYFFGIGIGNTDKFIEQHIDSDIAYFFQKTSGTVGTSIDNTAMLLFISFGYLSFVYLITLAIFFKRVMLKMDVSIVIYLILFHFATGHLYTPFYWLIYVPLADHLVLPRLYSSNKRQKRKTINC